MTLAAEFPNDNPDLHEGTIWVCLDVTGLPVAERRPVPAPLPMPIPVAIAPVEIVEEPPPPPPRESGIFMVVDSFSSLREEDDDDDADIVVEELAPLEDLASEILVVSPDPIVIEPAIIAPVILAPVVVEEVVAVAPDAEPIVEAIVEPVAEAIAEPVVEPIVALEPEPEVAPVVTLAPPPPDDAWVMFVSTLVDIAIAHGATAAAAELPAKLEGEGVAQAWAGILRGTSEDWDAVGGSMLDEWAAATLAHATGADAETLKRELRSRGVAAFGLAA